VPTWLCKQVGTSGWVLAADLNTSALQACPTRAFAVGRHDLTVDPAPAIDFDFVQARLVLEHLSDPMVGLMTIVAALGPRAGGCWWNARTRCCSRSRARTRLGPREALANTLRNAFWEYFSRRSRGGLGRSLAPPVARRRVNRHQRRGRVQLGRTGSSPITAQSDDTHRPGADSRGFGVADEIDRHLADLDSGDLDVAVFPIVSVSGRLTPSTRQDTL
jgi:hypothetical protein